MTDYRQELRELLDKDAPTLRGMTLENRTAVAILNYLLSHSTKRVTCRELDEIFSYYDNVSPTLSGLSAWQILDNEDGRWFISEPAKEFKFTLEYLDDLTHFGTETNRNWLSLLKRHDRQLSGDRMDQIFSLILSDAIDRGYTRVFIHSRVDASFDEKQKVRQIGRTQ